MLGFSVWAENSKHHTSGDASVAGVSKLCHTPGWKGITNSIREKRFSADRKNNTGNIMQ
jgi:hypothetical protein